MAYKYIMKKIISQLSELWSSGSVKICSNRCSSNFPIWEKVFQCLQCQITLTTLLIFLVGICLR